MLQTANLSQLTSILSPAYLSKWSRGKERVAQLNEDLQATEQAILTNPFGQSTEDQIIAWTDAMSRYEGIQSSKAEIERQQAEVTGSMVREGGINLELKTKDAFYAKALDQITQVYLKDQEDALTKAYEFIYQKQKRVSLDMVEERGKKTIKLTLHPTVNGEEYEESVEDEGFSVQVTLGTILLVHFIVSYKLPRVIFFDESFGGHEDSTLERFMTLLQQFRDVLGFRMIIVTHDRHRMVPFADKVYVAKDGKYRLHADGEVYNEGEGDEIPEGSL
jgi:ABC-type branched-subunit amino acid transport system ATPase component